MRKWRYWTDVISFRGKVLAFMAILPIINWSELPHVMILSSMESWVSIWLDLCFFPQLEFYQ